MMSDDRPRGADDTPRGLPQPPCPTKEIEDGERAMETLERAPGAEAALQPYEAGGRAHAGDATHAAPAAQTSAEIDDALDDVAFQIMVGRIYARMRAGHLDWCSKGFGFTALVAVTGAVADAFPAAKLALGVIGAAAGTAEPVFGFGKRAYEWTQVVQANQDLLVELDDARRRGVADPQEFLRRYHAVRQPEEAEFQIVRRIAWNAAAIETGRLDANDPQLCKISWFDRLTAHWTPRSPG